MFRWWQWQTTPAIVIIIKKKRYEWHGNVRIQHWVQFLQLNISVHVRHRWTDKNKPVRPFISDWEWSEWYFPLLRRSILIVLLGEPNGANPPPWLSYMLKNGRLYEGWSWWPVVLHSALNISFGEKFKFFAVLMQRAIFCLLHVDYRPLATTYVHITSAGVASIVLYIKISLITLLVAKQLLQYVCETWPTARLLVSWHVLLETYIRNNYEQHCKQLRTSNPCRHQSPVLLVLLVVTQFCSNLTT